MPVSEGAPTAGAEDRWGSRCNKSLTTGGPDAAWIWTAPEAGRYVLSTAGSGFDTVLALREPACDGAVLRCNDDVLRGEVRHSRIVADLSRHETVLVTVDGWGPGDQGDVRLSLEQVEADCEDGDDDGDGAADCDDDDCATAPVCRGLGCPTEQVEGFPFEGHGRSGPGESLLGDASCGDGAGKATEVTYGFSAPHTGSYLVETSGSGYDTLLYVRDGSCTGPELMCDDDGGGRATSALRLDLERDQRVVIVVDGFDGAAGDFRLAITGVEQRCDDGEDDDGDGLVDCDDGDCLSADCALGGAWPDHWTENESEMLDEVNARRAAGATCGQERMAPASPLEMNERLTLSARLHSLDMARQDYFEHTSLDARQPDDRMRDAGFVGAHPTGENIAAGNRTAAEAVEAFMGSPGHCRNIMEPAYRVVGFGYAYEPGSSYGHYWTQNFGGSH